MRTRMSGVAELLTMDPARCPTEDPDSTGLLGRVRDAALIVDDATGCVSWLGPQASMPPSDPDDVEMDLGGAVVMPGLVDAHTHLVFAGDRTEDFADRCRGVSYEEVAKRGGGIRLTVRETRAASSDLLAALARARLDGLLRHGVTTVEVKSGYGLSVSEELRHLEVIARLNAQGPQRLVATVLGAHIVPDEFRDDRQRYVAAVASELLPEAARRGLATHADVFCEVGAFSLEECERLLTAARDVGLGLKVHAEQLTHTGASGLAARLGAVSADHLEHLAEDDIHAMAEAGTVAVLLPAAGIFLGSSVRPPARRLLAAGVPVALATDCNPGTCPTTHLPLLATLGSCWLQLSPAESLYGITGAAAAAIGRSDGTGALKVGGPADLVVMDVRGHAEIVYRLAASPAREVWIGGRRVYQRPPSEAPPWR